MHSLFKKVYSKQFYVEVQNYTLWLVMRIRDSPFLVDM